MLERTDSMTNLPLDTDHRARGLDRRTLLLQAAALAAVGISGGSLDAAAKNFKQTAKSGPSIRTVLGPVPAAKLGVALMHEHAPVVDWSELYEVPPAPIAPLREQMLKTTADLLQAFHKTLDKNDGPGAIVECTPIRVGRYPDLLVELAKQTPVHIIACTGFWCEAMAPQHPWAVRMGVEKIGVKKMAQLYIREINEGMEDPSGAWGEKFTDIKVGIIKCATSKFLRPSERQCHLAASIATKETGCPITTHTTDGGGLEEAHLFLKQRVKPDKVIIGHQGNLDDREQDEAHEYHRRIVALGCNIQFDRVGHAEKYANEKIARQIKRLVETGHVKQILLSHDHVPYFYSDYTAGKKTPQGWEAHESDFTVVTTGLVKALKADGLSKNDIHTIISENPRRVLAF